MKNLNIILMSFFVLNIANTACGLSPELNHRYPDRNATKGKAITTQDGDTNPQETVPGCDFYFKSENLCATMAWTTEPGHEAAGTFTLSFWNKDQGTAQQPVFYNPSAAQVSVKLWMPAMGHGSSPVTFKQYKNAEGIEMDGVYEATNVFFVMPGAWEIVVQFKDQNGIVIDSSKITYQAN